LRIAGWRRRSRKNWFAGHDPSRFGPRRYPIRREVSEIEAVGACDSGLPLMRKMRRFWPEFWL
jgi:hypothetical protein